MTNLANQNIQRLAPYKPPLQGRRAFRGLRLDFNERTRPASPKVTRALREFFAGRNLPIYPEYGVLEKKIATYAGIKNDRVLVTNGSDQAIDLIFRTFTRPGDRVVIPAPSFAVFSQCARIAGNDILAPQYGAKGEFPLAEVLGAVRGGVRLAVICNPNNPTGTLVKLAELKKILQAAAANKALVFVDEAYFEFSDVSAVELLRRFPNLIISRTFSKAFGLAALRIGYLLARPVLIAEMAKVRGPYAVNMAAYVAAGAALDDRAEMRRYAREVMQQAKPLVEKFFRSRGIEFMPSAGNFILFRSRVVRRAERDLLAQGVRVRRITPVGFAPALRVTIGTEREMRKFIRIAEKINL